MEYKRPGNERNQKRLEILKRGEEHDGQPALGLVRGGRPYFMSSRAGRRFEHLR